jgi:thioesterase domain-containing protein
MAQVEKAFGRRLPVSILIEGQTVAALAAALSTASERNARDLVVPIRASGSGVALFCPHPYGGQVMSYLPLSRLLDDHPVFGLRARGLEGESAPHNDIATIAREHIEAMKTVQSVGPYHLVGFSMGGTIAWEMACQLQDAGEHVAVLAMLDSAAEHAATSVRRLFGRDVPAWLSGDCELLTSLFPGLLDLWSMVAEEPVDRQFAALRRLGVDRGLIPAVDEAQIRQMLAVARHNGTALRRYRPRSYGGGATLFVARDGLRASLGLAEDLGWGRYAMDRLETISVPGSHYSIMAPPDVSELGKKLKAALSIKPSERAIAAE